MMERRRSVYIFAFVSFDTIAVLIVYIEWVGRRYFCKEWSLYLSLNVRFSINIQQPSSTKHI